MATMRALDLGDQVAGVVPVGQDQCGAFEHAVTLGRHTGLVIEGVVDAAGDAPAHPLAAQLDNGLADRGLEAAPSQPSS
jgi:hypothetical protein